MVGEGEEGGRDGGGKAGGGGRADFHAHRSFTICA